MTTPNKTREATRLNRLIKSVKDPSILKAIEALIPTKKGHYTPSAAGKGSKKSIEKPECPPYPCVDTGSFSEVYLFVLQSIFRNQEISKDFYARSLSEVSFQYKFLIKHHGITQGSKKWKERTNYTILVAEGRNPDPLAFTATVKGTPYLVIFKELVPLIRLIQTRQEN